MQQAMSPARSVCFPVNNFNEAKEPDKPFTSVEFPKMNEDMWANIEQTDTEDW